ncbi:hypothetical protein [Citrobacter sp. U14242]
MFSPRYTTRYSDLLCIRERVSI